MAQTRVFQGPCGIIGYVYTAADDPLIMSPVSEWRAEAVVSDVKEKSMDNNSSLKRRGDRERYPLRGDTMNPGFNSQGQEM